MFAFHVGLPGRVSSINSPKDQDWPWLCSLHIRDEIIHKGFERCSRDKFCLSHGSSLFCNYQDMSCGLFHKHRIWMLLVLVWKGSQSKTLFFREIRKSFKMTIYLHQVWSPPKGNSMTGQFISIGCFVSKECTTTLSSIHTRYVQESKLPLCSYCWGGHEPKSRSLYIHKDCPWIPFFQVGMSLSPI